MHIIEVDEPYIWQKNGWLKYIRINIKYLTTTQELQVVYYNWLRLYITHARRGGVCLQTLPKLIVLRV